MKTKEELKLLAESALIFTGFKKQGNSWLRQSTDGIPILGVSGNRVHQDVFHLEGALTVTVALFVSHLALQKMEKRGYISFSYFSVNKRYRISTLDDDYFGSGNNNFIAFWSAIEKTGEK